MDEDEQNRYVAQLKDEFDSCDTTGTGYLDKEELTALCHKLSLDAHLPLLLDTLLGPQHYARVNFEEFKEGFVAVLSRSLDFSTSEEESSYLEPAVPEEVKPKYVKGTKRYGRRSRPDKTDLKLTADSDSLPFGTDKVEANGVRRAKLRRSTSLESVESLKSDEDTGSNKESTHHYFVAQGQLKLWNQDGTGNCQRSSDNQQEVTDGQVRAVWEDLGVGAAGSLNREELSLVCDHIGLKHLEAEELDALFRKLDKDQDGKVSLIEFQSGLFKPHDHASPLSTSTPARPKPLRTISKALEERVVRSTSPSLLSATVGQRLLTRLDDGSGCTSPEKVMALWTEEGIHNSRDILQTLDFSLEERLCLAELTLALDNELLVSGNGIHQAALVSYKNEINYLQVLADQACQERDKAKADLEQADRRNLQLVREVDDRHATMESLNESKIKYNFSPIVSKIIS